MSLYDQFKTWTSARKHTDIWRAVTGIVFIAAILLLFFGLAGCTSTGPSLTLASSHRGDGFIRVHQTLWEPKPWISTFIEYEHHSEVAREFDEDTYDGGLAGITVQFGDWK